jgi:HlyD family secretion protein
VKKKLLIGVGGAVVVVVLVVLNMRARHGGGTEVEVEKVTRHDVKRVVTASGNIQARRRVNVSASAMGKITRVAVEEGQYVERGDFLLQIDPTRYQSSVEQLEAAARGAQASLGLEQASLKKARYDLEKAKEMHAKGFATEDALRDAEVALEMAQARVRSAEERLSQTRADLVRARHDLDEVRITAEMSGVITALNVEEGETAIVGTMNNPGTVLLTIADLSEIEAEVLVDETEVVLVEVGQSAEVRLDAYPDTTFAGRVAEVGNSSVRQQLGMGQESVDFKVVVTIEDDIPATRPGLSASVDITVAEAFHVLAVPIQSLTVREDPRERKDEGDDSTAVAADTSGVEPGGDERPEVEGVLVVDDGAARFRRVGVGITGETHFSILWGLSGGERVITGPFRAISDLEDGDPVKVKSSDD